MSVSQIKTFSRAVLLMTCSFIFSQNALAVCEIFPNLETRIADNNPNRIACLKEANFLLPIPAKKTQEEIIFGPKSDEAEILPQSTVYCRYFYRYQNGSSNKFRCIRTNESNVLMNEKGEPVLDAVTISTQVINGKTEENVMMSIDGKPIMYMSKKGELKPMIADVLKVRFKSSIEGQKNQSDLNEWRHREAYTSAVASRLAWIMGFPAETYYPTKEVVCFGCDVDPWKNGLEPQLKPVNKTNIFPGASIERKFDGKRILKAYTSNPKLGKVWANTPWRWDEYITNFKHLTPRQKHEIQVLALFIGLLHTVEERGSQHVLLCEKNKVTEDKASGKKYCLEPIAGTHDLGSAFGNRDPHFVKNKNHPRGDYHAYKSLNMFLDNKCSLTAQPGKGPNKNLPGLKTVTEAARREFVTRLDLVSKNDLISLLQVSNFQDVDMIFKRSVEKQTGLKGDALNLKVIELWADLIYSKMDQFRNAQCANQDPL